VSAAGRARTLVTCLSAVALVAAAGCAAPVSTTPSAGTNAVSPDDPFLDTLQERTFRWFWDNTDHRTGLTPDRWPTKSFSSVAAIGFGLSAYVVGAERGWVSRAQAAERALNTMRFLHRLPQGDAARGMGGHRGFFYHFLGDDGTRFGDVELSTIDTALLFGGVLVCQRYFDGSGASESAIRAYADSLVDRAEWTWIRPRAPLVNMGWKPEQGFLSHDWQGYNEAMLLYVLALGSRTHAIGPDAWDAWTRTYRWDTFHGQPHLGFAPLFGHQFSHVWIDFRGIQDAYMRGRGIDYFENSRRATLAQRAYAIANPRRWRDYSGEIWGLTAVDGPKDTTAVYEGEPRTFWSYTARGAAAGEIRDDGTLAPTAVGGAVPFAPEVAIPTLKAMRARYGEHLFTRYGFLDSFNPSYRFGGRLQHGKVVPGVGWFDGDHLGIDQGPILLMIENYRTGLLWRLMRESPPVVRGLCRAGFQGGWLEGRC
jgi:hypothetical protein